ncbi:MAG TPA: hypothetical protein VIS10_02430 [Anaerolineales bacterium]
MDLIPEPLSGKITLAIVPRRAIRPLLGLAARLAQRAPLLVLDGGNCFNAYVVALALRQQTTDVTAALERIRVSRAFTCYQMVTLLEETPATPVATLVLDFLATFRDENVPQGERLRLIRICLERLRFLASAAPLLVSASPDSGPPMSGGRGRRQLQPDDRLLALLEEAADQVWRFGPPPPTVQLRLL